MKRRTCLRGMLAAGVGAAGRLTASPGNPIQLHVDLVVDPAREREILHNFATIFRPEAAKHPGFIDVKLLKLRTALQGSVPAGFNYRFALTYQTEELRQKWVASAEHQRVWPAIEKTLASKNLTVLLFDVA